MKKNSKQTGMNEHQLPTLYIQNGRDSSKFKVYSPLQSCLGLISLNPAAAHFAYTLPLANIVYN